METKVVKPLSVYGAKCKTIKVNFKVITASHLKQQLVIPPYPALWLNESKIQGQR